MFRTNANNRGFSGSARAPRKRLSAGFTLIEMLVVVAIIVIVTSLALAKNSQFNNTILLSDTAYDISFSIRQAQVYGLSVREFTGSGISSTFSVGYGVYFSANTPSQYTLFVDIDRDHLYQNPPDAIEQSIILRNNYKIATLCGSRSGTETCDLSSLAVAFERPNPDTFMSSGGVAYDSVRLVLQARGGDTRSINIFTTGQISVAGQ